MRKLTADDAKGLGNRYWVAKARFAKAGLTMGWPNFATWLEDVEELAPADFTLSRYRIFYNQGVAPGGCKKNMEFHQTAKARRYDEPIAELPTSRLDESQRLLLASEIAMRLLLSNKESGTLNELVEEALIASGITLPTTRSNP
jgi:hypothetical protein